MAKRGGDVFNNQLNSSAPARIHILLAKNSYQAIVIRRGPSRQTAAISRNRKDDTFFVGQWLKGRVYHYRCDISPNGEYWIYFAMKDGKTWTCVAKTPYFTALDFYSKGDSWNGGGLFLNDRAYWLNDNGFEKHKRSRKLSPLSVTADYPNHQNGFGECPMIYFIRLRRDGWQEKSFETIDKRNTVQHFSKRINDAWDIVKKFHGGLDHPIGKGIYHESHLLLNKKTGEELVCPDWEWADVDGDRLLWAEKGLIYAGVVKKQGLEQSKPLFDCNDLCFENLVAPY
ncbi:MAG: hypothetical protein LBU73_07705 [Helicobacteraceae bacterium]|jgi:hypothetical protein|nr:hypothetical protein [Helicobacteraceae bacterium]